MDKDFFQWIINVFAKIDGYVCVFSYICEGLRVNIFSCLKHGGDLWLPEPNILVKSEISDSNLSIL